VEGCDDLKPHGWNSPQINLLVLLERSVRYVAWMMKERCTGGTMWCYRGLIFSILKKN
jgi:hypothetical protein